MVSCNMRILERMGHLNPAPRIARGAVIAGAGRRRLGTRVRRGLSHASDFHPPVQRREILPCTLSLGECFAKKLGGIRSRKCHPNLPQIGGTEWDSFITCGSHKWITRYRNQEALSDPNGPLRRRFAHGVRTVDRWHVTYESFTDIRRRVPGESSRRFLGCFSGRLLSRVWRFSQ